MITDLSSYFSQMKLYNRHQCFVRMWKTEFFINLIALWLSIKRGIPLHTFHSHLCPEWQQPQQPVATTNISLTAVEAAKYSASIIDDAVNGFWLVHATVPLLSLNTWPEVEENWLLVLRIVVSPDQLYVPHKTQNLSIYFWNAVNNWFSSSVRGDNFSSLSSATSVESSSCESLCIGNRKVDVGGNWHLVLLKTTFLDILTELVTGSKSIICRFLVITKTIYLLFDDNSVQRLSEICM